MTVRFELNGESVEVDSVEPHVSLLQWLRASGRTGTKEGCAEGECGACAVAIVSRDTLGRRRFESVNSCLVPLSAVAARAIVTVEGVASRGGALHPVQQSMVDLGGSQCGYCTPGFVMSLFCEYYRPGRTAYDPECIAGNLCRCTGYRPIADVARTLPHPDANDRWLDVLAETDLGGAGGAQRNPRFARPTSLEGLFQAFADYPGARVIAGGTDLMVSANRRQERWPALIAVDAVAELQQFTWKDDEIVLGAGLSLASIDELVGRDHRGELALLEEVFPLFSSRLIRHRATLGGNLANASPVGDASPALLALGASLMLSSLRGERQVALGDFFAGYRRTVLEPGEIIVAIRVPRPLPRWQRFYKVSKRVQDDISTVAAGFALDLDGDRVARLRVAYGGVAATPLCAVAVERCAIGRRWDESTLRDLVGALDGVGTPQSDLRGSAAYRGAIMRKLLERFFVETRVSSDGAT